MERELMGYGSTADIYKWSNHTILKLFKKTVDDQTIEYESLIHEIIYDKAIPMPKLLEEVEIDGQRGYIYERISSKTLLYHILKNKWKIHHFSKTLASTQMNFNYNIAPLLPDLKEQLREDIQKVRSLKVEDTERLMAYINLLPNGNHICHLDYHPGNLFYNNGKGITFDWATARRSVPAADVANTYLLLKHRPLFVNGPLWVYVLDQLWRNYFTRMYLKHYFKLSGINFSDIEPWLRPLAIARLSHNISDIEKDELYSEYL